MTTRLELKASEGSTFGIVANFVEIRSDIQGSSPITPNDGLTWSLKEKDGSIVNSRKDVPLVSAPSVIIVLSGADLALPGTSELRRYVTIKGSYNSLLGSNLPILDEASFQIENLVGV